MDSLVRIIPQPALDRVEREPLRTREWIVTNGLGGYASGTVLGFPMRRYHGMLIAAMPAPLGRMVMLNHIAENLLFDDGRAFRLAVEDPLGEKPDDLAYMTEFRLEKGLPVWKYEIGDLVMEKRIILPHHQNTTYIIYRLLSTRGGGRLQIRPAVHFRPHDAAVHPCEDEAYGIKITQNGYEISSDRESLTLRLLMYGEDGDFTVDRMKIEQVSYPAEERRGYEATGSLWSPGYFEAPLQAEGSVTLVASTEPWEVARALSPEEALAAEGQRRRLLLASAIPKARRGFPAELVLAADQFIIAPAGRMQDEFRARASGFEMKTVIAGYHWFTDWGRDTMISLEGLTLLTGRPNDAAAILRAFGYYLRDGLIPNMFPEGSREGLYHTADATLWFFHALDRYLSWTGDRDTLRLFLPKLMDVVECYWLCTRFNIHVDQKDGLIAQGSKEHPLTWMDAKVGDWIVTPRRGKAVEINALWYNALRLLSNWSREEGLNEIAEHLKQKADQVYQSFNSRFWFKEGGYLYDVVDGEKGNEAICRPNQVFSISLPNPVLQEDRWEAVMEAVRTRLLTPLGLRSLSADHADYKPKYYGDIHARDAAYHQGTVWTWLIGPFVDAWLKVHPDDAAGARRFVEGLAPHLNEKCVGTIGEIFDADPPFYPHGCVAQAWSVAEVLRSWVKTEG